MSRQCVVTGKKRLVNNAVSHSHNKTKATRFVNLKTKKVFDPETGLTKKIKISARGIKTLDKVGSLSKHLKNKAKKSGKKCCCCCCK
jgi:large subunit ribosomal protein L28